MLIFLTDLDKKIVSIDNSIFSMYLSKRLLMFDITIETQKWKIILAFL
jgi:hypothetical protein